jgi:hypothetical protein
MEHFAFEGCSVGTYDIDYHGIAGCYIQFKSNNFVVIIDAEDATKIEEIGYFVVTITPCGADEDDWAEIEGAVISIDKVKEICGYVSEGRLNEAYRLLLTYDVRGNRHRTSTEIDLELKKQLQLQI